MPAEPPGDKPPRRIGDRPLLYPYNRRLRHLTGISLRNLCTNPPSPHPSRPASPAAGPPSVSAEPAASRSESDGGSATGDDDDAAQPTPTVEPAEAPPPILGRKRANTTLSTVTCTAPHRRPNVFFSLHVEGEERPVYVSEVMESTMNPDFLWFELGGLGAGVTRLGRCAVRVFVQEEGEGRDDGGEWTWLLEEKVELAGLGFLGKTLENWQKPLPENCVVYWLADGAYAAVGEKGEEIGGREKGERGGGEMTTGSYDSLMNICNLATCITDAESTTRRLTDSLNKLLESNQEARRLQSAVSTTKTRLGGLQAAIAAARRRLQGAERRREGLKEGNKRLRETLAKSHVDLLARQSHLASSGEILDRAHTALSSTREALHHIRRQHLQTLSTIFPITFAAPFYTILSQRIPRPAGSMFTPLPDAPDPDPDEAAAATGYIAHYLHLLSFYLSVPLRYPVHPFGSRSSVRDTISVIQGARSFPLWVRGAVGYRFEYGVFLVSKDVEQLLGEVGVRVVEVGEVGGNLLSLVMCFEGSEVWKRGGGSRGRVNGVGGAGGGAGGNGVLPRTGSMARIVRRGPDGKMRIEERASSRAGSRATSRAGSPAPSRFRELLRVPDG